MAQFAINDMERDNVSISGTSDHDNMSETTDGEGMFDTITQELRIKVLRPQPPVHAARSENEWEVVGQDVRLAPTPSIPFRLKNEMPDESGQGSDEHEAQSVVSDTTTEAWQEVPRAPESAAPSDIISLVELSETPYVWTPLGDSDYEIRVVDIAPATVDVNEPVQCHTRQLSLRDFTYKVDEMYQALSYTWGPRNRDGSHLTEKIWVDGKMLKVTANLHAALKQIRSHLDARRLTIFGRRPPLWVDALCINQEDVEERGRQVKSMAWIYGTSSRVVVWLGEASQGDGALVAAAADQVWNAGEPLQSLQLFEAIKKAVDSLLRRPWFQRRWVIHEYALKSTRAILFGEEIIDDTPLISLIKHLSLFDKAGPMTYTRLFDGVRTKRWLLPTLHRFSAAQCADPHDLVYALLSVSCGCGDAKSVCSSSACGMLNELEINYEEDVKTLFLRLARTFAETDVVSVLACASIRRPKYGALNSSLPSWVPDWRLPIVSASEATVEFIDNCFQQYDVSGMTFCKTFTRSFIRNTAEEDDQAGDQVETENCCDTGSTAEPPAAPLSRTLEIEGWLFSKNSAWTPETKDTTPYLHQLEPSPSTAVVPPSENTRGYTVSELFATIGDDIKERFRGDWPEIRDDQVVLFLPDCRLAFILARDGGTEKKFILCSSFRRPLVLADLRFQLLCKADGSLWMNGSLHPLDALRHGIELV